VAAIGAAGGFQFSRAVKHPSVVPIVMPPSYCCRLKSITESPGYRKFMGRLFKQGLIYEQSAARTVIAANDLIIHF
jgi:hypothetical protein